MQRGTMVRVTNLQEFVDRHGKFRRYYRRKGAPRIPISTKLHGLDLAARIAELNAKYAPLAPKSGTIGLLVKSYKNKSDHWRNLRALTRRDYEKVFTWLGKALDKPLTELTPSAVAGLRDKAREQRSFKFANQMLATLSEVSKHGVESGELPANPVRDIARLARPEGLKRANPPWEPLEVRVALQNAPLPLLGPLATIAYLAVRPGDMRSISRASVKGGMLRFTASKNRRELELPITDDLAAILKRAEAWRPAGDSTTLFVSSRGTPWSETGLDASFQNYRDTLGEQIRPGLTIYGLRHTVATILEEAGFAEWEYKHLLGHGKKSASEHYSSRAKRLKLLQDMTQTIEAAYRLNVIPMRRNESVKP